MQQFSTYNKLYLVVVKQFQQLTIIIDDSAVSSYITMGTFTTVGKNKVVYVKNSTLKTMKFTSPLNIITKEQLRMF